jgi:NinG protein
MAYNSTIRAKVGHCEVCGKYGPLTSKKCNNCYWNGVRLKSVNKMAAKDEAADDDLQDLINDADIVYSRWLRMNYTDKDGTVSCFTCSLNMRWQLAQCGHYVKRGNLFLRWDHRNTKCQCEECNIHKGGNYSKFTANLEAEHPGITTILIDEGRLVYKPTRYEIQQIISEYTQKLKNLTLK